MMLRPSLHFGLYTSTESTSVECLLSGLLFTTLILASYKLGSNFTKVVLVAGFCELFEELTLFGSLIEVLLA